MRDSRRAVNGAANLHSYGARDIVRKTIVDHAVHGRYAEVACIGGGCANSYTKPILDESNETIWTLEIGRFQGNADGATASSRIGPAFKEREVAEQQQTPPSLSDLQGSRHEHSLC